MARTFDDGDGMVRDMFEPHVKPTKRLCVAAADRSLTAGSIYLPTVEHITSLKRQLNCCVIRLDRQVNEIIKQALVRVKRYPGPSDLEVSGHSLRVGAAQDLLIKGHDMAAIMKAGGWTEPATVSRYLRFSKHNIWHQCYN